MRYLLVVILSLMISGCAVHFVPTPVRVLAYEAPRVVYVGGKKVIYKKIPKRRYHKHRYIHHSHTHGPYHHHP